jgi:hypothetical protein
MNKSIYRLRENNLAIGKFAIEHTTTQIEAEVKLQISNRETAEMIEASSKEFSMNFPTFTDSTHSTKKGTNAVSPTVAPAKIHEGIFEISSKILIVFIESLFSNRLYRIDFTPLYQCLNVFKNLGFYDEFEKYYRDNRKVRSIDL